MEEQDQERVLELMRAIDRARRAWRNADPDSTLNKSQFFTMLVLRHGGTAVPGGDCCRAEETAGPMTLSELARALHQTMPAVSQRITKLEELGYVKRTPDESDRRTVWITVTEEGSTVVDETRRSMVQFMGRVMARMEAAEPQSVDNLISGCHGLADAMKLELEN